MYDQIDLENIKGVLLDLDNTLYAYDPCHEIAQNACVELAYQKYKIEKDMFEQFWKLGRSKVHKDLKGQGSSHSRLLYFQKLYEGIFSRTNADFSLEMEETYWATFLNHMTLDPAAESFLKRIKQKGLKTCIVTDLTSQIQFRKWQKCQLGNYIDYLVSSEEAGIEKPGSYMFELALDKIKLSPNEVIMVGDNIEKDIKGAELLGIKAYHVVAS